ncbi:recombinase RecB [Kytococcus schroeteri]|uniref:Recombinase RecB n=1 Tax=Kytococcus schroeteri TaxID=138300 RepID=A0A2I1PDX3_9MICO|nr:PD-(D/E)XK nuclease family protein [Kytococcus schroeteri]PKZ42811.1 recombinase RecB [Kytococcus schroeteri]
MVTAALSPSRAGDFMQCPLLYRFRVVDRLPEPPSAVAVRGTFVHAVLEDVFDLPAHRRRPDDAVGLMEAAWERVVAERPEAVEVVGEGAEATPDEMATWMAEAEALVRRWFTLEDPSVLEPAERELYVEVPVEREGEQGQLTLRGYVDRLDVAPADGALRVVDYKTGRAPSELFQAKALFQMKFYALAIWRLRGRVPALLQLVYLKDGTILRHQPTEAELVATERKLLALYDAIERAAATGDWRPNRSRLCDWCSFQSICPAWGGTPPPLPTDAADRATDEAVSGAASLSG